MKPSLKGWRGLFSLQLQDHQESSKFSETTQHRYRKLKKEHDANNDEKIRMWLLKKSEAAIQRKVFVSQMSNPLMLTIKKLQTT